MLYNKTYINNISGKRHEYIICKIAIDNLGDESKEITLTNYNYDYYTKLIQFNHNANVNIVSKYMELLDGNDGHIFVMNNKHYAYHDGMNYAIYHKYRKSGNDYILENPDYYIYNNSYYKLINSNDLNERYKNCINVIDDNGNIISRFELDDNYIYNDNKYILNPKTVNAITDRSDKRYFIVIKEDQKIPPEECYILSSDGKFVPLINTNLYDNKNGTYNISKCFVITDDKTIYYEKDKRFYIEVQRGTCEDCGELLMLPHEPGIMPQAILVVGSWRWPMEGTHICEAYPYFSYWAMDPTNTTYWNWHTSPQANTYVSY